MFYFFKYLVIVILDFFPLILVHVTSAGCGDRTWH